MPDSTLYLKEILPFLNLIDAIISQNYPSAGQGSIALYGQKFGESARPILTFDLINGSYRQITPISKGGQNLVTSSQLSHLAIDEIQTFYQDWDDSQAKGSCQAETYRVPVNPELRGDNLNQLHSGTFVRNHLMAFGLTAQHGRFLCSCYLDNGVDEQSRRSNIGVLYAMARALQLLNPQDSELQKYDVTTDDFYHQRYDSILQSVQDTIYHRDLPSLEEWIEWREHAIAHNTRGELFA